MTKINQDHTSPTIIIPFVSSALLIAPTMFSLHPPWSLLTVARVAHFKDSSGLTPAWTLSWLPIALSIKTQIFTWPRVPAQSGPLLPLQTFSVLSVFTSAWFLSWPTVHYALPSQRAFAPAMASVWNPRPVLWLVNSHDPQLEGHILREVRPDHLSQWECFVIPSHRTEILSFTANNAFCNGPLLSIVLDYCCSPLLEGKLHQSRDLAILFLPMVP